jgi:hypothetical protein
VEGAVELSWYGVAQIAWLLAVGALLWFLLSPQLPTLDAHARLQTAAASILPFLVVLGLFADELAARFGWHIWLAPALALLAVVYLFRAQRASIGERPSPALLRALITAAGVWWAFNATVYARPEIWYAPDDDGGDEAQERGEATEGTLYEQPDLIDAALATLRPGTPGHTDVFFVGFAGDGEQRVFDHEARFALAVFGKRFSLEGHALELINTPKPDGRTPLASMSALQRALAGVAERMDLDEDVLILFMTSHGSEDGDFAVSQGVLPLNPVRPEDLRAALEAAGIRWRILVISSCFSGAFIPPLEDEHTLILTASSAERTSFGCEDDRELTYFGEAFLRDALSMSSGLVDAFGRARKAIARRERDEHLQASDPQIALGRHMKAKLAELEGQR